MISRLSLVRWSLCGAALLVAGCGRKPDQKRGGDAAPVIVAHAERKAVPLALPAIGAVEPIRTVSVRSQANGTLLKIHFQEGDDVKAGELLFELDSRPFENSLRSAEADLEKTRVQLSNAEAQVKRYSELKAGAMITKEQLETIRDNARALRAGVLSSEAAVANARLLIEYCSIRAPIAGRTGSLGAHEGDLVRAGDTGVPLVVINQLSPIYVTFTVPQQNLALIRRYRREGPLHVEAAPAGSTDTDIEGELTFIDNTIDATTGTLRLKATFDNPDHRLWPGQFVKVRITLATPSVVVVPSTAVQRSQDGAYAFVVKSDHTAEERPVEVERTVDGESVIARGLAPGEIVITDGQLRVLPGRKVQITSGRPAAETPVTPTASSAAEHAKP
ncbi:efflux RND transporter periplasmic adaptor subunit [Horticoccus luteus]|uniref:Efflux RND transporter periplasmic adaptor subunit n=1 Tax=Horticoccus luteus TaxID=2862869 RepID=A0A8F9TWQ8_9BACT|nr:efflux RND transporter periplasmic adaptor subunit [Horticoccus luteus]QYM80520.1 efflux RND transporter periplasmic adaptor subunit [Horticoccus luteus]